MAVDAICAPQADLDIGVRHEQFSASLLVAGQLDLAAQEPVVPGIGGDQRALETGDGLRNIFRRNL